MIVALRVELQDDVGESFHTDAELTRAIQKTVSLLSRFIPKREVVESTIVIDIDNETFAMPAAASATYIVSAASLISCVSGDTLTLANKVPDVPRRLTLTLTDANSSITSLSVLVKGYDQNGHYIEETWQLPGLVSATAIQGKLYFKRVKEVKLDIITGNGVDDTLSVGTGNAYDSDIFLAHKAIEWDSETVCTATALGGTKYVRDTDYTIDYLHGRIRYINGGGIAAGASLYISYDLDSLFLDLSTTLPSKEYVKLERVEYPIGDNPPTILTYDILGDTLLIKGKDVGFTEGNHIRIVYLKPWGAPGVNADGDYPEHLDNAIIIGSTGQALLFKAELYVQEAATENGMAEGATGDMSTPLRDINIALDKVAVYLTNNGSEDAKYWLTKITTDIADLRTAIATALNATNTYLDEVDTTDLGQASVGAEAYTETGDDKIITVNDADRVPENYADYARVRLNIATARTNAALGYIQEAFNRLSNLRSYIEQASAWGEIAAGFRDEATQRIAEVNAWAVQANEYNKTSAKYLEIAGRCLASGQAKVNEFLVSIGVKPEFHTYKSSSEQFS